MENNSNNQTSKPMLTSYKSHAGGFNFSLAVILYVVFGLIVTLIISGCGIQKGTDAYIYLNYLCAPCAIIISVLITVKFKKLKFKQTFPVKCHPKYFIIGMLLIYGLLFSLSWIDTGITALFKLMGYKERGASSYLPTLSGGWIVLALFVIGVMPAIFEESLFRGVILNTCEESVGTINTIFIVGFAFSLFHSSPEQTVYQFLAGSVFAFLALRSGSILPSVLIHFLNNALIVIFGACNLLNESGNLILSEGAQIALIVTSALAFVGGMVWLILDKKPYKKGNKEGVKAFFLFASVGIVVLAINWVLAFFVN